MKEVSFLLLNLKKIVCLYPQVFFCFIDITHEISQISNSAHFSPICDFQNALIDFKLEINVFLLQDLGLSCSIMCILILYIVRLSSGQNMEF